MTENRYALPLYERRPATRGCPTCGSGGEPSRLEPTGRRALLNWDALQELRETNRVRVYDRVEEGPVSDSPQSDTAPMPPLRHYTGVRSDRNYRGELVGVLLEKTT